MSSPPSRLVGRSIVVLLAVLSLLPLVNWIVDERSAPWYGESLARWVIGSVAGVGLAFGLAARSRRHPALWREGSISGFLARFDPASFRASLGVAFAGFVVYAAIALFLFDGRPLHVDEVVQLIQARMLAQGRLSIPIDPDPAFRAVLHLVDAHGRWFGQFPPGWPLLLAIGDQVGAPWLVNPVVGALAIVAWGAILRRVDAPAPVRGGALLLFAFAPFTAFLAGSEMNHPAALAWILAAIAGMLATMEQPSAVRSLAAGLAIGMAAITRPADAAAFAVPAALWLVAYGRRTGRWSVLAGVGAGLALPLGFLAFVNWSTTGSAVVSGYQLLWGNQVGLGFHPVPWGPAHTPLRGLELVNLYLLRLNNVLFETPMPGLLFSLAALFFAGAGGKVERYLLASGGLLLAVYFAYWHDGFYLGPRFVYPLLPVLCLATARLPGAVLAATGSDFARRTAAFLLGLGFTSAVAWGIPIRAGIYAASQPTMRFDPDRAADAAGVKNALVFVQESWGATVLARLWALGIGKPDAERIYHGTDTCILDQALGRAEPAGADPGALGLLAPLAADSGRLVASPFSPDTSERVLNGASYPPMCIARINEDRAGFTLYAPLWLARRPDIYYARNLHERNARLVDRFPGRALYLLTQRRDEPAPRFVPLRRDSVLQAR